MVKRRLTQVLLLELFLDVFKDFFTKLFLCRVITHYGILQIITAHLVYEHTERDTLGGQLAGSHVLEEFVYFSSFVGSIRALDN